MSPYENDALIKTAVSLIAFTLLLSFFTWVVVSVLRLMEVLP